MDVDDRIKISQEASVRIVGIFKELHTHVTTTISIYHYTDDEMKRMSDFAARLIMTDNSITSLGQVLDKIRCELGIMI